MIGIFDSGWGGLTVLKAIIRQLPRYDYTYLGDNARAPYGNKSQEVIYGYTKEAVDFLFAKGCVLVIVACNTASSEALRTLQQNYLPGAHPRKRVLGVIRPLVEKITQDATIQRVGIIGTKATVASGAYLTELRHLNPRLKIYQQAAPLLVPLIEEGWLKRPETKMILKKYLQPLKQQQVQTLLLACTHYPFLLNDIRRVMTKRCAVPDPGEIVAASLTDYLTRHPELGIQPTPRPTRQFYTTDNVAMFQKMGSAFLNKNIEHIQKIALV